MNDAIALFQEIGDEYWLADEYATMAFLCEYRKLDAAFESAGKALVLAEPRNFRRAIAAKVLSNAYGDLEITRWRCTTYVALEIQEAATKSPFNISSTLDGIGGLYTLNGSITKELNIF